MKQVISTLQQDFKVTTEPQPECSLLRKISKYVGQSVCMFVCMFVSSSGPQF